MVAGGRACSLITVQCGATGVVGASFNACFSRKLQGRIKMQGQRSSCSRIRSLSNCAITLKVQNTGACAASRRQKFPQLDEVYSLVQFEDLIFLVDE